MPAKSDKQQIAARIAHAIKKGKVKPKKGTASAQMAKGMSDKQIKHFMVKEEGEGGTTSVNVGGGSGSVPPKKKSKIPPQFQKYIKKKKGEEEKEKNEAALRRVMQMVYAEESHLQKLNNTKISEN